MTMEKHRESILVIRHIPWQLVAMIVRKEKNRSLLPLQSAKKLRYPKTFQ